MTYTTPSGVAVVDAVPFRDVYYDDDLASGSNDGSSPANAWQSLADMEADVKGGDRVNMRKAASAVTLAANFTFPAGDDDGPIFYRGYGIDPGDGVKWEADASTFNFNAANGPQVFMDLDFTSASTNYTFLCNADDQSMFYRCDFANTSTGSAMNNTEGVCIECTFLNTGTYVSSGCEAAEGDGVYIGCTFESEGHNANMSNSDESEHTLMFGCTCIASLVETRDNIRLALTLNESSYGAIIECSCFDGQRGIRIQDVNSTHESTHCVLNNVVWECDIGLQQNEATAKESPHVRGNAVGGSTTSDYDSFGDWEDLFTKVALAGDPYTDSGNGDLSLNNTAGAGALCRDAVIVGLIGGSGAEQVTSAGDLGGVRHGSDDGGMGGTLASGTAGGGGLDGRNFGLLPVNKTSEIA